MNETYVTFQGWLGNDPAQREVGGVPVATFRVGSTPRRFNRASNGWVDGETTWFTVNAWRSLGRNCMASLKQGDAVTVHGRLGAQSWTDDEEKEHLTYVVEGISVGHDLNKGTSAFVKYQQPADQAADDSDLRALNAELGGTGPQVSSDGVPVEKEPAA